MFSQASVSHFFHRGGWGVLTSPPPPRWTQQMDTHPPPRHIGPGILRDTVDKRPVRILLEFLNSYLCNIKEERS